MGRMSRGSIPSGRAKLYENTMPIIEDSEWLRCFFIVKGRNEKAGKSTLEFSDVDEPVLERSKRLIKETSDNEECAKEMATILQQLLCYPIIMKTIEASTSNFNSRINKVLEKYNTNA